MDRGHGLLLQLLGVLVAERQVLHVVGDELGVDSCHRIVRHVRRVAAVVNQSFVVERQPPALVQQRVALVVGLLELVACLTCGQPCLVDLLLKLEQLLPRGGLVLVLHGHIGLLVVVVDRHGQPVTGCAIGAL